MYVYVMPCAYGVVDAACKKLTYFLKADILFAIFAFYKSVYVIFSHNCLRHIFYQYVHK